MHDQVVSPKPAKHEGWFLLMKLELYFVVIPLEQVIGHVVCVMGTVRTGLTDLLQTTFSSDGT